MSYDRFHPFYATLKERYCLNRPGSEKETLHLSVDLTGSGIHYLPGDSFAIIPKNDPQLVEKTLKALKANDIEIVVDPKTQEPVALGHFLAHKANLTRIGKPLLTLLETRATDPQKRANLATLLSSHEGWSHYASQFEVWDLLEEYADAEISAQELCQLLQPTLPRFYSAASAQSHVGDRVDFAVGVVEYVSRGYLRMGVASQYLGRLVGLNEPVIPLYLQAAHSFRLPENGDTPIVMVGPGTGVAPFRAFMQERLAGGAKGPNWLFFGEQRRATDYLYEEFWRGLVGEGRLQVDAVFSRDQEEKKYVQHRMLEKAKELWRWLEEGAYFYVCGDAHHMAKDVDATLHKLVAEQGGLSHDESRAYVKNLKLTKRYLRDVY